MNVAAQSLCSDGRSFRLLSRPSRRSVGLVLSVVIASLVACSETDVRSLSAADKARLIHQKRKFAAGEWAQYDASQGADLESLEAFARLHVETTKIAPDTCDLCFLFAAVGLRRVGNHFRHTVGDLDRQLQSAGGAGAAPALEAEIQSALVKMRVSYRKSNAMYMAYFSRATSGAELANAYWAIVDNHYGLEEYDRALHFLLRFEETQALGEADLSEIRQLRRRLQVALRLQEEKRLDEELKRGSGGPAAGDSRRRFDSQPAN